MVKVELMNIVPEQGNIYRNPFGVYILASADDGEFLLVNLMNGKRWAEPACIEETSRILNDPEAKWEDLGSLYGEGE